MGVALAEYLQVCAVAGDLLTAKVQLPTRPKKPLPAGQKEVQPIEKYTSVA
jgi:hypothetical protein